MVTHKIIGNGKLLESHKWEFGKNDSYESRSPGNKIFWWILFFIAASVTIAALAKKENPAIDRPSDEELFERLPDNARKTFTEKYGQPDDDDRKCELYYLVAKSGMARPCIKCPIWCGDLTKTKIFVSAGQVYYIGKTCRGQGKRENEHRQLINALNLEYQGIKRGTEGYITTQEQLHLKTYFTRPEAIKEGCRLFLPPGNTIGMSQQEWKELLKELN